MRIFDVTLVTLLMGSNLALAQNTSKGVQTQIEQIRRQNEFALNCVINSETFQTASPICQVSFSQIAPSVTAYWRSNQVPGASCDKAKNRKDQEYPFLFINDEATFYCLKKDVIDRLVLYTQIYREVAAPSKKH